MTLPLAFLFAAIPTGSLAQTALEIEIVAAGVVPEHRRHLARTDQDAMIDAWAAP